MKKSFRNLFAILIMAGSGFTAYGKAVDVNTAMTTGGNFLKSAGVNNATNLLLAYTQTDVVKGKTVTDFYVFNVTGSKAFVIVSADDNVIPILAYSNSSSFDINNIAPSTTYWLSGYKKQISALITNGWPARAGTAQRWNDLETGSINTRTGRATSTTAVAPLLASTWDQSPYYNDLCPNTGLTGGLSVTGCVATAMAQVMNFWQWPTVGTGSHTYTDPGSGSTLTANFGATAYQWSSMPMPGASSANNAVATLMLHAGISVDMNYSADGSGAYVLSLETYGINCAQYALWAYFHYKPSTLQGLSRFGETQGYGDPTVDSIAETTWITMLQTELNAGRPILYDGAEADGEGHCWVLDGWETSGNMFHFNWGWGGFCNGYFTVDNLDPFNVYPDNLNLDQGVIMGIEPDSFPSTPGNLELLATLNANVSSPMPYKSPFSITTKILNTGGTSYSGDFCAQVYDSSNSLVATIATITGETIAAGDSSATLTFSSTGIDAMVPFLYSIRVLYRPTGSSTWTPVANNGSLINYTMLGINNDTDVVLYDSLHVGSHTVLSGTPLSVTTIIGDQSATNTTFTGSVQAVMINITTGTPYTVQQFTSQTIDTSALGSTFTFTCSATPAPGLYALTIQHQYNGTGSFYTTSSDYYSNPVLINIIAGLSVPTVAATTNNVYVYPNPAKDNVTIATQGAAITGINVMDITGRTIRAISGANQSMVSFPVTDLAAGTYLVQVETVTGTVTKKIVINR